MKRLTTLVVALFLVAAPVRAHFIWIMPGDPAAEKPAPRLVFNDDPSIGNPDLLKKIAKTDLFARDLDLKAVDLKLTEEKDGLHVDGLGKGPEVVGGVCKYGVFQKGDEEPALLYYYPKTYIGEDLTKAPPANLIKPWDKLALEIVPVERKNTVQVLWKGKPLARAKVVLYVPGRPEAIEDETDKDGMCEVRRPRENGVYGIRALYTDKTAGEVDNKKYSEVRHYATLTFPVTKFTPK